MTNKTLKADEEMLKKFQNEEVKKPKDSSKLPKTK